MAHANLAPTLVFPILSGREIMNIIPDEAAMARIPGAPIDRGGLFRRFFVRTVYSLTRRKLGRVVMPVQVTAHHAPILWRYGQMEQSMSASKLVDEKLKGLVTLRVATLIGCPF
jgi:hypothetical protein